jgi:hypothetical protein
MKSEQTGVEQLERLRPNLAAIVESLRESNGRLEKALALLDTRIEQSSADSRKA